MVKNLAQPDANHLFNEITQVLDEARNRVYQLANFAMVQAYWEVGRLIIEEEQKGEQRAEYGKALIKQLSTELMNKYGKGFDVSNLRHMRNFYSTFQNRDALRRELSWTHYRLLLKVEKGGARSYYMEEAIENRWSTRTLERQINRLYFERVLASDAKNRPSVEAEAESNKIELQPEDFIKDPYLLDFLNLGKPGTFYEKDLEQGLIDKLQSFLLELGKGFSFVERQHSINMEGDHYYVDLVFYNYILKCFVLIDLKVGKLTHQDLGQMDMYVRYFEDVKRIEGDNPTIGLILCADKNNTMAKYSLLSGSKQLFASKYKTYLPTEKELQQEIERGRHQIEIEKKLNR
jgi:predicted nuclease of restriction endonuclease-like (RecB) superfamily